MVNVFFNRCGFASQVRRLVCEAASGKQPVN
jgi:hypothetical protein